VLIDTTEGDIDESQLTKVVGEIDDHASFRITVMHRLGRKIVRRAEAVIVSKVNPFYASPEVKDGWVTTTRGPKPVHELCRTIGSEDRFNEYACWVEYREPGDPVVIHRSVHVMKKRNETAADGQAAKL
jgi:hypothetical protein